MRAHSGGGSDAGPEALMITTEVFNGGTLKYE